MQCSHLCTVGAQSSPHREGYILTAQKNPSEQKSSWRPILSLTETVSMAHPPQLSSTAPPKFVRDLCHFHM